VLGDLMGEKTIVTAFLKETVGTNITHSMLEDRAGVHQYKIVDDIKEDDNPDVKKEKIEAAKEAFLAKLKDREAEFDNDMWKAVIDKDNKKLIVTERSVSEALLETAKALGMNFIRASVGNISLSDEVTKEANKAASEVFQRDAQMDSAKT